MKIRMYGLLTIFFITILIVSSILTSSVSAESPGGMLFGSKCLEEAEEGSLSGFQIIPVGVVINGQYVYDETRATLLRDRFMVPLSKILKKSCSKVAWEDNNCSVLITEKQGQGDNMDNDTSQMVLDEKDNGKLITLHPGEEIRLFLSSNPSTGFRWVFNDETDNSIVSITQDEFQSDVSGDAAADIVGAGGKDCWKISALNAGSTTLSLSYMRPWEKVKPLYIFELEIEVLS